ncbi:hypothetical protein CONLIGDRAFT_84214 [Coniochaeta ligniaria NRRL 30616]|uniref:Peptidase C14 caspase domain-containing protein n=1 Tax=Coniochaeta ligniaria NRRL 30616 TaxID=1408157 RepID=A0A1J7J7N9_9PEZI|nr:hypothetical protein CONLIGDRAFT_84214 [Coniochaeta ligniaria NRRL 30616]
MSVQGPRQGQISVPGTQMCPASGHIPRGSYRQVIVLVVYFANGFTPGGKRGVNMVEKAFMSYHYSVVKYALPDQEPTHDLLMKLRVLQEHISPDTLLIIYYAGHGGLSGHPDSSLHLAGSQCFTSATTIRWRDIYPRILSFKCDVLTILDCCRSGAAALTPCHVAAVNTVHQVDTTFSKEVIATAGFQTVCWAGQEFSLALILPGVLRVYQQTGNLDRLDSSILFNEVSFRMKEHYKTMPPGSFGSGKRTGSWQDATATNPVHYEVVQGTSRGIALRPLAQPRPCVRTFLSAPLDVRIAHSFQFLYGANFTSAVLAFEAEIMDNEYEKIRKLQDQDIV